MVFVKNATEETFHEFNNIKEINKNRKFVILNRKHLNLFAGSRFGMK